MLRFQLWVSGLGFEQAYNTSVALQSQIQGLINEINSTTDPKSIAELQARIAGEQTKVQNAMMQMQLSPQLAEVKNELLIQQQKKKRIMLLLKQGLALLVLIQHRLRIGINGDAKHHSLRA